MSTQISVIIITYNQEKKILRCLNSLLRSKTRSIELIIADDCSKDNTQQVVISWLAEKGHAFKSVSFIRQPSNLGIVANICNAVAKANGDFIKLIAGDDWFCDGAIDSLQNIADNSSFDVAFSPVLIAIEDDSETLTISSSRLEASKKDSFFSLSSKEQFNVLALMNLFPAPGSFFSRSFWNTIRLEDYGFKTSEDWPMWLLGSLKGVKFIKISEPLVVYLRHRHSVTQNLHSPAYKKGFEDTIKMYRDIVFPNKDKLERVNLLKAYLNFCGLQILSVLPNAIIYKITALRRKFIRRFMED